MRNKKSLFILKLSRYRFSQIRPILANGRLECISIYKQLHIHFNMAKFEMRRNFMHSCIYVECNCVETIGYSFSWQKHCRRPGERQYVLIVFCKALLPPWGEEQNMLIKLINIFIDSSLRLNFRSSWHKRLLWTSE